MTLQFVNPQEMIKASIMFLFLIFKENASNVLLSNMLAFLCILVVMLCQFKNILFFQPLLTLAYVADELSYSIIPP